MATPLNKLRPERAAPTSWGRCGLRAERPPCSLGVSTGLMLLGQPAIRSAPLDAPPPHFAVAACGFPLAALRRPKGNAARKHRTTNPDVGFDSAVPKFPEVHFSRWDICGKSRTYLSNIRAASCSFIVPAQCRGDCKMVDSTSLLSRDTEPMPFGLSVSGADILSCRYGPTIRKPSPFSKFKLNNLRRICWKCFHVPSGIAFPG